MTQMVMAPVRFHLLAKVLPQWKDSSITVGLFAFLGPELRESVPGPYLDIVRALQALLYWR